MPNIILIIKMAHFSLYGHLAFSMYPIAFTTKISIFLNGSDQLMLFVFQWSLLDFNEISIVDSFSNDKSI